MVNCKQALFEGLMVLALTALVVAAPAADCEEHHEQQQSGSENYRLSVDNVIVAVAPAEALLMDFGDFDLSEKPIKPISVKPLANLIKPLVDMKPQELTPPLTSAAAAVASKTTPESSPSGDSLPSGDSQPSDPKPSGDKEPNKEVESKKQEKAQRFKLRLINMLLPLLKRTKVTRE